MKVYMNTQELNAGVSDVVRALSQKSVIPILEGICFLAEDSAVTLICTDMSLRIETRIAAGVTEEGCVIIPGRLFAEIVRRLPEETVELETQDNKIVIKSGRSRSTLQISSAQDYPAMPEIGDPTEISISQNAFRNMIRQTIFATTQDDTKPMLNGILLEAEANILKLVALDGFSLALRREPCNYAGSCSKAIVPTKSLSEISRMMLDSNEPIKLVISKTHIAIDLEHTKIVSRLLDVNFINYDSILTKTFKTRVRVKRAELLEIIERASLISRENKGNAIRMKFGGDMLKISAVSELGSVNEELPVEIDGDSIEIAFNARFMSDVFKSLEDEEVYMNMINRISQCVICPIEGDAYQYVVLPMRILDAE